MLVSFEWLKSLIMTSEFSTLKAKCSPPEDPHTGQCLATIATHRRQWLFEHGVGYNQEDPIPQVILKDICDVSYFAYHLQCKDLTGTHIARLVSILHGAVNCKTLIFVDVMKCLIGIRLGLAYQACILLPHILLGQS